MVSENVENLIYEAGNVKKKIACGALTENDIQTIINPPNTHFRGILHFTPLVPILPPWFFRNVFYPLGFTPLVQTKKNTMVQL